MNREFFTILRNIIFLVIITILIILSDRERNWLDMFTGFVVGISIWELAYTFRDIHSRKKKLR